MLAAARKPAEDLFGTSDEWSGCICAYRPPVPIRNHLQLMFANRVGYEKSSRSHRNFRDIKSLI